MVHQFNKFENDLIDKYNIKDNIINENQKIQLKDFLKNFTSDNQLYEIYKKMDFNLNKSYKDLIIGKGNYKISKFKINISIEQDYLSSENILIYNNTFETDNIDNLFYTISNGISNYDKNTNIMYSIKYNIDILLQDGYTLGFFEISKHLLDEAKEYKHNIAFNDNILKILDNSNIAIICDDSSLNDILYKDLGIDIFNVTDYTDINDILVNDDKKIIIGDIADISRGSARIKIDKGILNIIITNNIDSNSFNAFHVNSFNNIFIGPFLRSDEQLLFSYDDRNKFNNREGKLWYNYNEDIYFDIKKTSY